MKKKLFSLIAVLFLLSVPALPAAAAEQRYVFDDAGLLTEEETADLEATAAKIADEYGCGVYIATVKNFTQYGSLYIEDFSESFYQYSGLGVGSEKNGLLLVLSMADRDYDLCAYGSFAHQSFTDYGKGVLSDEFLDDLAGDEWYEGFCDYLETSREFLALSAEGTPVDVDSYSPERGVGAKLFIILVPSILSAAVVCFIFLHGMKSARRRRSAHEYVTERGVNMYVRQDIFTHRTQQRQVIQSSSSSGGTSINSRGFSHRSGKF